MLSVLVLRKVVALLFDKQRVVHAQKHDKPRHVQENQDPHKDVEKVTVSNIANDRNALFQCMMTVANEPLVNGKGQDCQSRVQPGHCHDCETGHGGPLPFEKVGQFAQIHWNICDIVNQKSH